MQIQFTRNRLLLGIFQLLMIIVPSIPIGWGIKNPLSYSIKINLSIISSTLKSISYWGITDNLEFISWFGLNETRFIITGIILSVFPTISSILLIISSLKRNKFTQICFFISECLFFIMFGYIFYNFTLPSLFPSNYLEVHTICGRIGMINFPNIIQTGTLLLIVITINSIGTTIKELWKIKKKSEGGTLDGFESDQEVFTSKKMQKSPQIDIIILAGCLIVFFCLESIGFLKMYFFRTIYGEFYVWGIIAGNEPYSFLEKISSANVFGWLLWSMGFFGAMLFIRAAIPNPYEKVKKNFKLGMYFISTTLIINFVVFLIYLFEGSVRIGIFPFIILFLLILTYFRYRELFKK